MNHLIVLVTVLAAAIALLVHFMLREQGLYHTHALLLIEQNNYIINFLTVILLAIPIIVTLGIISGLSSGVSLGIGTSIAVDLLFCFAGGFAGHPLETLGSIPVDALVFVMFGCILGIGFAIAFGNREVTPVNMVTGMLQVLCFCSLIGLAFVLIYGYFHSDFYYYYSNYYSKSYYTYHYYNFIYIYSYLYAYIHIALISATLCAAVGAALVIGRNISLGIMTDFPRGIARGITTGIAGSLVFSVVFSILFAATLMIGVWLSVDHFDFTGSILSGFSFDIYSLIDIVPLLAIGILFCVVKKERRGILFTILCAIIVTILLIFQFTPFYAFSIPYYAWTVSSEGIHVSSDTEFLYSIIDFAIDIFAGIGCGLIFSRIGRITRRFSHKIVRGMVRSVLGSIVVIIIISLIDSPQNLGTVGQSVQIVVDTLVSVFMFYAGVGLVSGLGIGIVEHLVPALPFEILKGLALAVLFTIVFVPQSERGVTAGVACFIGYLCVYYRVLLYPASGLSAFFAYRASRDNPAQVFSYLRRSSLYWDERVFLPLPGLKQILLLAAQQDIQQALEEVSFIMYERPQQAQAAREVLLEIALHELELCDTVADIAQVAQRLAEIFPPGEHLLDPRWEVPFLQIKKVSQDATRYGTPIGWQARYDALQDMLKHLKRVYPDSAFSDYRLNKRFTEVVTRWRMVVKDELAELDKAPTKTSGVKNPYMPATVLERHSNVFVGRRDLGPQLEEALSRGGNRPTFLLNGERRMGKSSALLQLPDLLGTRYIPIFYDLQSTSVISSTSTFLGAIAEKIGAAIQARGMRVKDLRYETLKEASKENEAVTYHVFDTWLKSVERTLEEEGCILLLALDEFERLDYAGQEGLLDLKLLLGWFRNIIQYRPRLALLFSGVQTVNEMSEVWVSHLVNVQTLKVSFLQRAEAYELITQPVPPIFAEGVVEEIMHVTGCHPFLIQAICSMLIDALNAGKRATLEMQDLDNAVKQVLSRFRPYFQEQWNRASEPQRACLLALRDLNEGDAITLQQRSQLDQPVLHYALETLLERDLIFVKNGRYRIAVPLFSEWVGRNE